MGISIHVKPTHHTPHGDIFSVGAVVNVEDAMSTGNNALFQSGALHFVKEYWAHTDKSSHFEQ